jgi:hypothetical protein
MDSSSDKIDPDAHYRVTDGPLKNGYVTILSVEEDGKRVRALVSNKDWVTPPIWLETSALKRMGLNWSPVSRWPSIGAVALVLLLLVYAATKSPVALAAAGILFIVGAIAFIRAITLSRRVKSCPICGTRLDRETWSHCDKCRWDRPMPHSLPAEMRAPWPAAGHKYARLLRSKIDPHVERDHCPRCRSSNWRRSFLSPRWGGRFTCLDCGRLWWPGTYLWDWPEVSHDRVCVVLRSAICNGSLLYGRRHKQPWSSDVSFGRRGGRNGNLCVQTNLATAVNGENYISSNSP